MTSTLSPLTQAVTGALGSATANALAYPLDLVATRLQTTRSRRLRGLRGVFTVLHQTVTKRGIDGLYDGLAPDTASTIIANFLYFYAYSFFRKIALRDAIRAGGQPGRTPVLSVAQELALGFLAGISSRLVTAPLSIITVRTQMELEESDDAPDAKNESKPVAAVKSIYAEDGLLGFWKGIESTILLSFNPALTFAFLHFIRRLMQFRPKNSAKIVKVLPSGPIESFVTGASANAAAVAILYPLILAKTRLQAIRKASLTLPGSTNGKANTKQPQRYRPTLVSTLRDAYTGEDGYPGGLYQGLPAQLIKCVIGMGVTIMIKERTEAALVKAIRRWRN